MRGSVSIFMIMSLTMTMSLVFTMSEVVRYFCMKSTADTLSFSAAQSGLGDYNRILYEKYGILAVDMGYGKAEASDEKLVKRITGYALKGGNPDHDGDLISFVNLFRMDPVDDYLSEITLLTDHGGAGFIKEASGLELYDITGDMLEKWSNAQKEADNITASLEPGGISVMERRVCVTAASGDKEEIVGDDRGQALVDQVGEFKKRGVLYQVLGSNMKLSSKSLKTSERVSQRTLNCGTGDEKLITTADKLKYKAYLLGHMGSYTNIKDRRSLDYEMEYIVSGHLSDQENLRAAVKKLLLMRELENLVALAGDTAKMAEAESMGAAASAAILNPELAPLITAAIVGAWAYVESVLDVRLLLSGGSVPIIKTPAQWTSNLATLPEYLDTNVKAIDVPGGIDYTGYLFILMHTVSSKKLGLRPLDLMECELNMYEDYANVRMDNMLIEARYHVTMTSAPIFLSLAPLVSPKLSTYEFIQEPMLSYL